MKKRLALALVLVATLVLWAVPVGAANPQVTIYMAAKVVSISNSQSSWNLTQQTTSQTVKWGSSDTYSQITNTGNVAVDIEIQGTDMEGGDYDLTLASDGSPGSEIYGLKANSEATPTVYDIVVKSSAYNDLTTDLAVDDTYDWSMQLYTPTAFNANDDGEYKTATVTLVASEH